MAKERKGSVEGIVGSMFSGKSEELIRRIKRAGFAKQITQVFYSSIDNRYGDGSVNSHAGSSKEAIAIESSADILDLLDEDTVVVGIDEAQFLDPGIIDLCNTLADKKNIRVIFAGLNTNFRGEPFNSIPELMARADKLDMLHAICVVCGDEASRTQRMIKEKQADGSWKIRPANYNDPLIVVAADEDHATETARKIQEYYEARCRNCHEVPGK